MKANRSGQVVLEYVLLVVISAMAATLIIKGMVSRTPSDQGFIIRAWERVLVSIGDDLPEQ